MKPNLGFGLGLRKTHYQDILNNLPKEIDLFEILTENYLINGGKPLYYLDQIRSHYPMVMHGVSLSIGNTEAIDTRYLCKLKKLIDRIQPTWISDHLCWTGINNINTHELLPLPYTIETINHIVSRIHQVQDYLNQQILIENISSYITFKESEMSEWDFITEICTKADCLILLDINNIFVNSINHNFNPITYIDAIPADKVKQIHLAGHQNNGDYIIDTHDCDIIDKVWNLYAYASIKFKAATVIERDEHIPSLAKMLTELKIAQNINNNPSLLLTNTLHQCENVN